MTAKKKNYYYLFTSILFFNILGVLFDTFFSQKLWDKILFKTVKHHIFFDSAFFEFFYFHFFDLCSWGIFFSLFLLIVTSLLPDSEQSEQLAEDYMDKKISASYEARKTNEEIIKHKTSKKEKNDGR